MTDSVHPDDITVVITGSDPTIVSDAVHTAIDILLGDTDASLALEEFALKGSDVDDDQESSVISRVIDAINTPPFLVPRRVVVLRDAGSLNKADTEALLRWHQSPTPGVALVVAGSGIRTDNPLAKAASKFFNTTVSSFGKNRLDFVVAKFEEIGVNANAVVLKAVADRLGEDVARAESLARTLVSLYGSSPLKFEHIEPYLGEAGAVTDWDLTDAIDAGRVTPAITAARRMLDSREKVGVQLVGLLQRHYLKMVKLSESTASTKEEAALIVGGSPFPAGKALAMARALGRDGLTRAIDLVAAADYDLKGGVSYGGKNEDDIDQTDLTVVEILVARLTKMSESARR